MVVRHRPVVPGAMLTPEEALRDYAQRLQKAAIRLGRRFFWVGLFLGIGLGVVVGLVVRA